MPDPVEVKIVADGGDAKSSMEQTARSIDASLQAMRQSLEKFTESNRNMLDQVRRSNNDATSAFKQLQSGVTGALSQITTGIERFKSIVGGLSAILAGGFLWHEVVGEMLRMEDAVRGLTITFGVNTEKATEMAIALKLAGIDAATYEGMAFKVGRMIKGQSEEFDRLGVKIRDVNNDFLPMDEILQNIFKRMQDFKAGTDQNEFALATVGRSAKDFASDMLRLNAVTERAKELQHELGIEMGPERIAEIEAYRIETAAFHVLLGNVADKIGAAVLPQLMELAKYFNETGPSAAKIFMTALENILSSFDWLILKAREWWTYSQMLDRAGLTSKEAFVSAMSSLLHGHAIDAFNIMAEANRKIRRDEMETEAALLGMRADFYRRMGMLGGEGGIPKPAGAGPMPSGSERFRVKPTGGAGAEENVVANFRQELEELKDAQGLFNEFSKNAEAEFWIQKLGMLDTNGKNFVKQYNEIYHLIHEAQKANAKEELQQTIAGFEEQKAQYKYDYEARIGFLQKEYEAIAAAYGAQSTQAKAAHARILEEEQRFADQKQKIADINQKADDATAKHQYEMFKLGQDQQLALRQTTVLKSLSVERSYLQSMHDMDIAALKQRIADYPKVGDPLHNPEEAARMNAELLRMEQDYQTKLTQIDMAAEQERQKNALAAAEAVESGFATFLGDIMNHTKSVSQAFKDMAASIVNSINQIVAKQIATSLIGAGTSGGAGLMSIFGSMFGGGEIPSFDVGTPYVPRDMLAFVHQGERITTAADNRAGGGQGHTFNVQNTFVLPTKIDTRTQDQIAARSSLALQRAAYRIT